MFRDFYCSPFLTQFFNVAFFSTMKYIQSPRGFSLFVQYVDREKEVRPSGRSLVVVCPIDKIFIIPLPTERRSLHRYEQSNLYGIEI